MKILSIVGARPEFLQAIPISQALKGKHLEVLVHTGQHYDYTMSQMFFDELDVPPPDYNLEVGSGSHARQTAVMLTRLEAVMVEEKPDLVIVRGATNSTAAGAFAASQLHIPLAHIEAGERNFARQIPEETNSLLTDCLANLHFCTSQTAMHHLASEGVNESAYWVGDVSLDMRCQYQHQARARSQIIRDFNLERGGYVLVTIHRANNTDDLQALTRIVQALNCVDEKIIFPAHPRTRKALARLDIILGPHVRVIEPVGYFDMMMLEENARLIATDSGGVQREAYYMGVPCLTLRDETEWVETIAVGWNKLVGTNQEKILHAWTHFQPPVDRPAIFGDGQAAQRIIKILEGESAQLPKLAAISV